MPTLCSVRVLDKGIKKDYNKSRVSQTVAGIFMVREESPGSIERGCRLTAGGGDSKDSATENKRRFFGKCGNVR